LGPTCLLSGEPHRLMFAFIISRILQAIPVMLVVGFLAYALFTFVGDPGSASTTPKRSARR
jgi:hypothetical protein